MRPGRAREGRHHTGLETRAHGGPRAPTADLGAGAAGGHAGGAYNFLWFLRFLAHDSVYKLGVLQV